ncbi:MAG TPA: hypothetical protein VHL58_00190 [Thermoanaerobaculia bacterium]|nr:hypothetical protein [Thermoanaerobaculia bacterium]
MKRCAKLLLALFLLESAAGLFLFLPLVGRRNAGVKFYRLIFITCVALDAGAAISYGVARQWPLVWCSVALLASTLFVYFVLRYPKRLIYRVPQLLLYSAYLMVPVVAFQRAIRPPAIFWSAAGALSSTALIGSVCMAMLLGHWYLVVRGMPIDPLKRLTWSLLACAVAKSVLLLLAVLSIPGPFERGTALYSLLMSDGVFFWMRIGWGLMGTLGLYPMIWGTVKIRSTMAATGILYVAVVAVIIGEVLGVYLSSVHHMAL